MPVQPIVHVEIASRDHEEAGRFYNQIFGWEIRQIPEMQYATFMAGETLGGGFNPITPDYPVGTVRLYINSDDIPADLRRIEQAGGKIIQEEMEIPETGWFAVFEDPTGNRLALFKPLMA